MNEAAATTKKLVAIGWIAALFILERLPLFLVDAPYLSQYEYRGVFGAYQIVSTGHLSTFPSVTSVVGFASFYRDFPGTPILWAISSELTGIPVLGFANVPAFSVLAAVCFYLIALRISGSYLPSFLVTILFTSVPFQFAYAVSSFVYTYLVFMIALFCLLRAQQKPSAGFSILTMVLFASLLLANYTAATFFLLIGFSLWLFRDRSTSSRGVTRRAPVALLVMFAGYLYETELFRKLLTSAGYGTFHRLDPLGFLTGATVDPAVGLPIYRDALASSLSYLNLAPMAIVLVAGVVVFLTTRKEPRRTERETMYAFPLLVSWLMFVCLMTVVVDIRRGLDFVVIGGLPLVLLAFRKVFGQKSRSRKEAVAVAAVVFALLIPSVGTVPILLSDTYWRDTYDYRSESRAISWLNVVGLECAPFLSDVKAAGFALVISKFLPFAPHEDLPGSFNVLYADNPNSQYAAFASGYVFLSTRMDHVYFGFVQNFDSPGHSTMDADPQFNRIYDSGGAILLENRALTEKDAFCSGGA